MPEKNQIDRCPFCGQHNFTVGYFGEKRAVVCGTCDAQGPFMHSEAAALAAWRIRAL